MNSSSGAGEGVAQILWTLEVTNGRDIELLSLNRGEEEVLLLPGARFAIDPSSITVVQKGGVHIGGTAYSKTILEVRARQVA
jgi:hypothetical protein